MSGMMRKPGLKPVGMKGRQPTPPVQTIQTPGVKAAKDAVSMAEGMNLDKPTPPVKTKFQTANPFRIKALQKRMNSGS